MSKKIEQQTELQTLPVLALRGLVLFPGMILQFDAGRKKSILALHEAMEKDQTILLVAQKDLEDNNPDSEQIFQTGVVAKIKQILHHTEDGVRLLAEGMHRARIHQVISESPFLMVEASALQTTPYRSSHKTEALIRYTQNLFERYLQNYKRISPDIVIGVVKNKSCGALADYIASNVMLDFEQKQEILEELHPVKRLEKLIQILEHEIKVLEIENEITDKARDQMNQNQRDYFLREQIKVINYELGEDDNPQEEAEELREKILKLDIPDKQREKLLKECDRFAKMPFGSHEASVVRNYLETCIELPWNVSSKEVIDLAKAQKVLDKDHYGLKKVKERILETLAVRKLAPDINGQIVCLVGPPGVGKTSIARSIAKAIGRKYVRVSLGGVHDESDIMGHRRTYIGSMPGRIMAAVKQAGTNNPLILLDEIDKLGKSFRGDPAAALLEVLDAEQNSAFYDHYIDMPFDLSKVLFLTTANDASTIPGPLLDRMDTIFLSSYTHEEKFQIAVKHLIPKQLKKHGISSQNLRITPAAVHDLIESYTREAGVRSLERNIAAICRKIAKKIVAEEVTKITVKPADLEDLLGPRRFKPENKNKSDEVGLVNGLAWTSVGGQTMPIEVAIMDGTGKLQLTGSLGNVMKESAQTAISCIRSKATQLGIDVQFYNKMDIHIHVPEGAIPKDGPSAGIAMATAITSALSKIPIRHDVAMTGEITLRGRVLAIGGLKEKSMAAYRNGIQTVIIPEDNYSDISEFDDVVKENIQFIPVKKIDEVLGLALTRKPQPVLAPKAASAPIPAQGDPMGTQPPQPVVLEQPQC
ncbi:endopeptidase La [Clostridium minihomine]|uniref:endopeptidase La n=1 Tax=Clostridium minihomine TaxID=2045012 RepID=UPI000C757986|nr:endopeptidase La [Clostridium minihomine]